MGRTEVKADGLSGAGVKSPVLTKFLMTARLTIRPAAKGSMIWGPDTLQGPTRAALPSFVGLPASNCAMMSWFRQAPPNKRPVHVDNEGDLGPDPLAKSPRAALGRRGLDERIPQSTFAILADFDPNSTEDHHVRREHAAARSL